tara:strand:- start:1224 stop:1403 length:180 start_codon:yes stop_codon:yes gene_type:complete
MRCKGCDKTTRQHNQGFTWREKCLCPACFMAQNGLKKVKINQVDRKYTVVYISKEMPVL